MKWNLDDIMPVGKFDDLYKEVEDEIKTLEEWVEKVRPEMSQKEFGEMLRFNEELGVKIARLAYLPELMEAVNQKNQEAKLMKSRVDNLGLKISDIATRLGLWIQGKREPVLDDKNAKRLFSVIPDLEYGLKRSREGAKFSLSEREEQIIDHKDVNGVGVLGELREMIETEFEYRLVTSKLDKKISSQAELLSYVYSPQSRN